MFWQTWWFRLACVLSVGLAIFAFYRARVRRLTRLINVRSEERLAERTRIAQELHDTLLQGVLSASMQLHVLSDRLPAESPERPLLDRVLGLIRRVAEEGRNAVRGLRTTASDPHDLEHAFSGIPEELVVPATTGYRVVV